MTLTDYIASLTITQGAGAGAPIRLLRWQRRFLRGFERTDGDCALGVSGGAGKSTIVSAIACAVVNGPLRQPRAEVVCVASSFAQGRIIFEHVIAFLQALGRDLSDCKTWRLQDSANVATVEHRGTGARVRCIGSDPKRSHGLAPLLVCVDEPAQHPATTQVIPAPSLLLTAAMGEARVTNRTRPATGSLRRPRKAGAGNVRRMMQRRRRSWQSPMAHGAPGDRTGRLGVTQEWRGEVECYAQRRNIVGAGWQEIPTIWGMKLSRAMDLSTETLSIIGIVVSVGIALAVLILRFQSEAGADRRTIQASMDTFRSEMQRLAERQSNVEGRLTTSGGD